MDDRQPIETAPKNGNPVDIWATGPGARWIPNCRWRVPKWAGAGGLACRPHGGFPARWTTDLDFGLDPRNGIATHWRPAESAA